MRIRAALAIAGLVAAAGPAAAQIVSRVSVSTEGSEGTNDSFWPSISTDGRFVAFHSPAGNLAPGDTFGTWDVFVRDRRARVTTRIGARPGGSPTSGRRRSVQISADGRFVAFTSEAADLVPGDANGVADVFLHDRETGETTRVSVDSSGAEATAESMVAGLSADGRHVVFTSAAANFDPGDGNGVADVFVHDRETGVTTRVSVDSSGVEGNGPSEHASISADGLVVAFTSLADNLVADDVNRSADVFIHDVGTGETSCVSVRTGDDRPRGFCGTCSISADGLHVAFASDAPDLVPGDGNYFADVFVHGRATGETWRASVGSSGEEPNWEAVAPSISADGQRVVYVSAASNLDGSLDDVTFDVFLHDRATSTTSILSARSDGIPGNSDSGSVVISPDGRHAAFESSSSNLVSGDTNERSDVFVCEIVPCEAGNVNGRSGAAVDVLFVNDSAGGRERTIRPYRHEPLTIFVASPPLAEGPAPFALFAWSERRDPAAPPFDLPFGLGWTSLPTPLTGGSPAPRVVWNNTGSALLGAATRPSRPAPSIVLQLPRGAGRPVTAYLQGIIRDTGAPNGRAAVTNGVTIEIR